MKFCSKQHPRLKTFKVTFATGGVQLIEAYGYTGYQNVIEFHLERPSKVVSVHAMWTIEDIQELDNESSPHAAHSPPSGSGESPKQHPSPLHLGKIRNPQNS